MAEGVFSDVISDISPLKILIIHVLGELHAQL